MAVAWYSPTTGRALHADTPHSLSDGQFERWPVVEGIPYLRTESEGLVALALELLDEGDSDGALIALLTDQDAWWTGPATDLNELRELVTRRNELTLREAMILLRFGPVGDYFAHRWSDPTFLAGLALLQAHWLNPRTAFELAGGIGHYAREMARLGVACISADIVFAKCWLARNWVAPQAEYVVFDAKDTWPIADRQFDLVHCQDAFYFLPDQAKIAERLRAAVGDGGVLAVGHLHNADIKGGAFGPAKPAEEWRALFPEAQVYDECELRAALLDGRKPCAGSFDAEDATEAWSVVEPTAPPRCAYGKLSMPDEAGELRPNPLMAGDGVQWPSERYAQEYGASATWTDADAPTPPERDRRLVHLPERW